MRIDFSITNLEDLSLFNGNIKGYANFIELEFTIGPNGLRIGETIRLRIFGNNTSYIIQENIRIFGNNTSYIIQENTEESRKELNTWKEIRRYSHDK